jgi:hypothetical protein
MYIEGLGFEVLTEFRDHEGFDGVILGHPGQSYHIEFTHQRGHSAGNAPAGENLLVFYIEDKREWINQCEKMIEAGFAKVDSYNPYWDKQGNTFEDSDGCRVVLQNSGWNR